MIDFLKNIIPVFHLPIICHQIFIHLHRLHINIKLMLEITVPKISKNKKRLRKTEPFFI
jgi:hypothetical protein